MRNYTDKKFLNIIERSEFLEWLDIQHDSIDIIYHLGARTDTTEFDKKIFDDLNLNYSKEIWKRCVQFQIPLVYASSAATYGAGESGYDDDEKIIPQLKPLNPYGDSKNDFDKWVLQQKEFPPRWCGLKFFNVYGPNEYHKGRMASVVFHAYNQIKENSGVKLFRSHKKELNDGEQLRDFIYVKDVAEVLFFLFNHKIENGIYNLGSGKARTFIDLVSAVFSSLQKEKHIEWIDIPEDIRDKYQYFTEAKMDRLKSAGYKFPFTSLEDGVADYVKNYLNENKIW